MACVELAMCGRFALIASYEKIKYQFHPENEMVVTPRYNIPPGTPVLCLVAPEPESIQCVEFHWGLIPSWATDRRKIGSLINARAETVFEKPAFHTAMKSKRCLMPMSGFFEWHQEGNVKQPYYFQKSDRSLLAIAALWDTWYHEDEVIHSCCLLTTEANELMEPVHHRMPVLLNEEEQITWLDNSHCNKEQLIQLMKPYPHNDLMCYPVNPLVNKAAFDNPLVIEPLTKKNL